MDIRTSEEPLVCRVRGSEKKSRDPDVLTTATGSFVSGRMIAGLIMSKVKPETRIHCTSGARLRKGERALTIFGIIVGCVYSSRICDCWRRETLRDNDFGSKLGARWSGPCGVNYAGIWAIWFGVAESEVADAVHG